MSYCVRRLKYCRTSRADLRATPANFEKYRFSEDLNFTVRDPAHLDFGFLSCAFAEIAERVYDASGLEMPRETYKFEVFNNRRGKPSAQERVGYRGPPGRIGDPPRMKLDLAHNE